MAYVPSTIGGSGRSGRTSYNTYGNSPNQVRDLQKRLGVTVDGSYGPATSNAVSQYQKSMGLTPDGMAGPATWNSLRKGQYGQATHVDSLADVPKTGTTTYTPNKMSSPVALASASAATVGKNKDFSTDAVDTWVDKLKKETAKTETGGPKLPAQIDLDKYKSETATIQDIAKKFGFDYSREYAEKQAEALAQAQRDEIANQRDRLEHETGAAKEDLSHDFFQKYLQQRQDTANSGLNAGIESERNLRLDMNRQNALADILANSQLRNQELDRQGALIDKEKLTYAEKLYNERLQQAFQNAMEQSRFDQSENQWQAQMEMQQRQQEIENKWREYEFNNMSRAQREQLAQTAKQHGDEMAWREYQYNNMSAAEKARFNQDAEQFGMEMAWKRHQFEAQMSYQSGYDSGFSGGSGGGGNVPASNIPSSSFKTSKGTPPQSYQNNFATALKATGFPSSWTQPMAQLIANESSWNPNAKNPNSTAHGYGQFLKSTRANYEKKYGIKYTTPVNQLILTMYYVRDRYGTPQKAMQFWNKNKWY